MWWMVTVVAKMDEVRQWWGDGVRCVEVSGDEMVSGWGRGGRRDVMVVVRCGCRNLAGDGCEAPEYKWREKGMCVGTRTESRFKQAFATFFGQDIETFIGIMFLNVEQLEKQLDKEDSQEIGSIAVFNVLETQFQMFIRSRIYLNDEYVAMTRIYFQQYTQLAILEFYDTLIQHMESVKKSINERAQHKREYDSWVTEIQMQITEEKVDTSKALDASLVDTKSSGTDSKEQDTSSRSESDAHDDAYIRPIYDEEPMAEEREASSAKPHHMIAYSNSRISSKNMPRFSSNDIVHNHYLEEAKIKTQERSRNFEPSLMPSIRSQSTSNCSKPNPRSNTQTSRNWPASKNSFVATKTMPIAEHSRNFRNFSDSKHFVCLTCQNVSSMQIMILVKQNS
nr:hypothetical protein [Tanacetum cinerariifolium]